MSKFLEEDYDNLVLTNYYTVLEIDEDATTKEIKSAYMKLAKKHHPDHGGNEVLFENVSKAYDVLSNKGSKKEYDLKLKNKDDDDIDNYAKLKEDFKTYKTASYKPMGDDQVKALYDDLFTQIKDESYNDDQFAIKISDIDNERKTVDIESKDDTIKNLLEHNETLPENEKMSVSDIFDYVNNAKQKSNPTNQLSTYNVGTYDTLGGYFDSNCSLFMNENNNLPGSNYSNLEDSNSMTQNDIKNIKAEDVSAWKNNRKADTKLSEDEIANFMKKREIEQTEICNEVKNNLKENVKETQSYLKIKNIDDEINFDEFLITTEKNKKKINIENQTDVITDDNFSDYFS